MQDMRGRVQRRLVALRARAMPLLRLKARSRAGGGGPVGRITSPRPTESLRGFARLKFPFFEASISVVAGRNARISRRPRRRW